MASRAENRKARSSDSVLKNTANAVHIPEPRAVHSLCEHFGGMVRDFSPGDSVAIRQDDFAIRTGGMMLALEAFQDADNFQNRAPAHGPKEEIDIRTGREMGRSRARRPVLPGQGTVDTSLFAGCFQLGRQLP